jgi:hypothetical protein
MSEPITPVVPDPVEAVAAPAPDPQEALSKQFAERAERAKKQGMSETLAALGVESIEDAKTAIEEARQLKAAQMSDADKAKAEVETERTKREEAERLLAEERTATLRVRVAAEMKLPDGLASRLTGSTEDELRADAKSLLASIPASSAGVPAPVGDVTPDLPPEAALQAEYDAAMKRGDTVTATSIKLQMARPKT